MSSTTTDPRLGEKPTFLSDGEWRALCVAHGIYRHADGEPHRQLQATAVEELLARVRELEAPR